MIRLLHITTSHHAFELHGSFKHLTSLGMGNGIMEFTYLIVREIGVDKANADMEVQEDNGEEE